MKLLISWVLGFEYERLNLSLGVEHIKVFRLSKYQLKYLESWSLHLSGYRKTKKSFPIGMYVLMT